MSFKRFGQTLVFVTIISGLVWGITNTQDILDWWRLRNYVPSATIAEISKNIALTPQGEKLFYVHDPELLTSASFRSKCSVDEKTIVLGCYIEDSRIYLFDVDDQRIEGVEEVTAAHEMLHAAYDRLSAQERERIDALTGQVFNSSQASDRLKRTIQSYSDRDPSVVPNELHSILGTEIRVLPEELESYYAQYFIDRTKVVTIAEAYEDEFASREARIASYDDRLSELNNIIISQRSEVEYLSGVIDQQRATINGLRSDPATYNAAIPSFNALVSQYNALVEELRLNIDSYNAFVVERNAIAIEEKEIFQAIDSRQQTL